MNVIEIFHDSAVRHAAGAAIVSGRAGRERTVSFAELDRRSRQIAALLLREGLQPGDGVAVFIPMSATLYATMAALLRLGMVPVFVEPAAWRQTLDDAMAAWPVRGFIGTPVACAARLLLPALRRIPKAFVANACFPGAVPLQAARTLTPCNHLEPAQGASPAILTFTSGSTGRPKGVPRSHGVLAETHRILSRHLALVPGQLHVTMLPFVVFTHLGAGVGSLIPDADLSRPGAVDARGLAAQIRRWKTAGIVASPALLERMADDALARGTRLDALSRVTAGGAPVFPRVLDKLAEVAPAARIQSLYGATEAEPIAVLGRDEFGVAERDAMHRAAGLLAGRPVPEVRLRILRDRCDEACGPWTPARLDAESAAADEAGEVIVSGDHVVDRYTDIEATRAFKIRVGAQTWHRTGDAGRLDAQGRLWLLGSCKGRIDDAHGRRYPLAVDAALSDHAALSRASLVRHRDRTLLVVQPRGACDERTLAGLARDLAWIGADALVAIRRLPLDRRHDAKIDQPRLRRMLDREQWHARVPMRAPGGDHE